MFKIRFFTLFLGIFFMPFFSYGQGEDLWSDLQTLEQQRSEDSSVKSSEGASDFSDSAGKSVLSAKGELLISFSLIEETVIPYLPLFLELQTSFKKMKSLKWLIQAGGGVDFVYKSPEDFYSTIYLLVDAGLRYDFQPWAASFTLGGYVTPQTFIRSEEVRWEFIHPVLDHIPDFSTFKKNIEGFQGFTGFESHRIFPAFSPRAESLTLSLNQKPRKSSLPAL